MPNHLHGILVLPAIADVATSSHFRNPQSGSLSTILNCFKGAVTRSINSSRAEENRSPVVVWQSRFYDRIIRNEKELDATRKYIIENPQRWQKM